MVMFAQNVVVLYHRKNSHQYGSQFLIITWPFFDWLPFQYSSKLMIDGICTIVALFVSFTF